MSITSYPVVEGPPYAQLVSQGAVAGAETLYKYGFNSDVDQTEETIWTNGGNILWPSSAFTAFVVSDNANDTSAGSGARTVTVQGLDENYVYQSITVSMNGTAQVQIGDANSWLRINRAFVATGDVAAGTILIQSADTTTTYANLSEGNQTQIAAYTVPAGRTLYLDDINFTAAISQANNYATVKFLVREFGGVWRERYINVLQSNQLIAKFEYPLAIPEKSDMECRAVCSNNDNLIGASFQGILVDNVA